MLRLMDNKKSQILMHSKGWLIRNYVNLSESKQTNKTKDVLVVLIFKENGQKSSYFSTKLFIIVLIRGKVSLRQFR